MKPHLIPTTFLPRIHHQLSDDLTSAQQSLHNKGVGPSHYDSTVSPMLRIFTEDMEEQDGLTHGNTFLIDEKSQQLPQASRWKDKQPLKRMTEQRASLQQSVAAQVNEEEVLHDFEFTPQLIIQQAEKPQPATSRRQPNRLNKKLHSFRVICSPTFQQSKVIPTSVDKQLPRKHYKLAGRKYKRNALYSSVRSSMGVSPDRAGDAQDDGILMCTQTQLFPKESRKASQASVFMPIRSSLHDFQGINGSKNSYEYRQLTSKRSIPSIRRSQERLKYRKQSELGTIATRHHSQITYSKPESVQLEPGDRSSEEHRHHRYHHEADKLSDKNRTLMIEQNADLPPNSVIFQSQPSNNRSQRGSYQYNFVGSSMESSIYSKQRGPVFPKPLAEEQSSTAPNKNNSEVEASFDHGPSPRSKLPEVGVQTTRPMIFRENVETEMEIEQAAEWFDPKASMVSPYEVVREAKKMKQILEKECGRFHNSRMQSNQQASQARMTEILRSLKIQQRTANLKSHLLNLKQYENSLAKQFMLPTYSNEPFIPPQTTETNDDYLPEVELKDELRNYPIEAPSMLMKHEFGRDEDPGDDGLKRMSNGKVTTQQRSNLMKRLTRTVRPRRQFQQYSSETKHHSSLKVGKKPANKQRQRFDLSSQKVQIHQRESLNAPRTFILLRENAPADYSASTKFRASQDLMRLESPKYD